MIQSQLMKDIKPKIGILNLGKIYVASKQKLKDLF